MIDKQGSGGWFRIVEACRRSGGMMGVIVGSAIVKVLVEAKSPPEGLRELDRSETITKSFKSALSMIYSLITRLNIYLPRLISNYCSYCHVLENKEVASTMHSITRVHIYSYFFSLVYIETLISLISL